MLSFLEGPQTLISQRSHCNLCGRALLNFGSLMLGMVFLISTTAHLRSGVGSI